MGLEEFGACQAGEHSQYLGSEQCLPAAALPREEAEHELGAHFPQQDTSEYFKAEKKLLRLFEK